MIFWKALMLSSCTETAISGTRHGRVLKSVGQRGSLLFACKFASRPTVRGGKRRMRLFAWPVNLFAHVVRDSEWLVTQPRMPSHLSQSQYQCSKSPRINSETAKFVIKERKVTDDDSPPCAAEGVLGFLLEPISLFFFQREKRAQLLNFQQCIHFCTGVLLFFPLQLRMKMANATCSDRYRQKEKDKWTAR